MRRLVLVRHSEPEIEPDKPALAWRLGEVGRRRSHVLAAKLHRDLTSDVIWSSREPKAAETADVVAAAFGVPVRTADGLEEHHRANVPFLPQDEFERAIEQFFSNPDRLVLGTETADQARSRIAASIDDIVEAGQADSIVVTHGTVIALYVASIADVQPLSLWRRLEPPSYVVLTAPSMNVHSIVEDVTDDSPSRSPLP